MNQIQKLTQGIQSALQMLSQRDVQIINMAMEIATLKARIAELEKPDAK